MNRKKEKGKKSQQRQRPACPPHGKQEQARKFISITGSSFEKHLFLEEAAQIVHHRTALRRRGTIAGGTAVRTLGRRALQLLAALVLLDGVFGNAADDGAADCAEEAVVGLMSGPGSAGAADQGSSQTALALLGFAGGALLLLIATGFGVSLSSGRDRRESQTHP